METEEKKEIEVVEETTPVEASSEEVTESQEEKEQDKKIVKNVFLVAISNIFTLLAGVLVGFVIPKILGVEDYGYYKIFTLYFGYTGLFHFGFCDGIYLYFAGKKYDKLNREKFRLYSKFLLVFQTIVLVLICGIAMFFIGNEYMFILLFVGLSLMAYNVTMYYQMISQITFRFKELSIINSVRSLLTIIAVVALYLIYKLTNVDHLNYQIYVIIFTGIYYALTLFYVVAYRDITFGKSEKFKDNYKELFSFFKIGFPLLLANLISSLLLNIDRQFVSIWFTTEQYSLYAFAYNLLYLVTTAIAAIATVLYPSLKTKPEPVLKKSYHSINGMVMTIVTFGIMCYFPLVFVVEWLLPQYVDSLKIFKIVYPGLIFSSSVSIILSNYYKALNRVKDFFIISAITLAISVVADVIMYYTIGTMESLSYASVAVLFFYYLFTELYITKKMGNIKFYNIICSVIIVALFYLSVYLIPNIYIQMAVFIGSSLVVILSFNFKNIKKMIKREIF